MNPLIKTSPFTFAESWIIIVHLESLQDLKKISWTDLSNILPGRPDDSIKNFWVYNLKDKRD